MDKTKMAVTVFDKRAKEYADKFMDVSMSHDTFDVFCDNITKPNALVLEIACGPGNITRYLLNKRPDLKICCTDLAANMIALAAKNNPEAECRIMDGRHIGSLVEKYDAIMCGFALPYFSKQEAIKLITDAVKILNPEGVLYISTMEGEYNTSCMETSSQGDQLYVHYHETGYLTDALTQNSFHIISLQRKEYSGKDGSTIIDLVIIAALRA